MKTINEIRSDENIKLPYGFKSLDCDAALYHALMRQDDTECAELDSKIEYEFDSSKYPGQAGYVIFKDDSIYAWSGSDPIVYRFVSDFYSDYQEALNKSDDEMDKKLVALFS